MKKKSTGRPAPVVNIRWSKPTDFPSFETVRAATSYLETRGWRRVPNISGWVYKHPRITSVLEVQVKGKWAKIFYCMNAVPKKKPTAKPKTANLFNMVFHDCHAATSYLAALGWERIHVASGLLYRHPAASMNVRVKTRDRGGWAIYKVQKETEFFDEEKQRFTKHNKESATLKRYHSIEAIEGELRYQEKKYPNHKHSLGEWALILEKQLNDLKRCWYHGHGRQQDALHALRKLTACGVAAMEQCGVEGRASDVWER